MRRHRGIAGAYLLKGGAAAASGVTDEGFTRRETGNAAGKPLVEAAVLSGIVMSLNLSMSIAVVNVVSCRLSVVSQKSPTQKSCACV